MSRGKAAILMKKGTSPRAKRDIFFILSPEQRAFLLEAKCGEGLFATKTWTQMEVVASPMEAVMADTTLVSLPHVRLQQGSLVDDKS